MHIGRLTKAALVSIATGLWLVHLQAGLTRSLLLALGGALVTGAWIALTPKRPVPPSPLIRSSVPQPARPQPCAPAHARIDRTPSGRLARDLRCAASRATARARRSSRR